ncbi:galactoside 2-alpha-L-fucosyltransferase 2-like [Mizuhopecten yessoensis]|uniref:galactoside 2-alpha-L-fucosyltransferase 2-like n=1 Tax=Mizuhopecten yessoensis TaxID=6573 RepID=UPI000B45E157|nr:galactoside 2-alpha-L-fucosyltransferase 2-like [Mizuhopecten yessoensis]
MKVKRQCSLRIRKLARCFLLTCVLLAVAVNITIVRAMFYENWGYMSFFSKTRRQDNKHSSLNLQPKIQITTTHIASVESPKCMFYESSTYTSETFRDSHFMTVSLNGRLGNQMFKYASLLGLAAQHGYTPFLRRKSLLFSVFESQRYFHQVSMTNDVSFGEHHAGIYDCRIHNFTHSKNITLHGYFQSWKYFHHISAQVRKLFRFTGDIVRRAKLAIDKFHPGNRTLIGVHVRRGDMNTRRELQRGYNVADLKYFQKSFEYFRYKFENAMFIVVSDSISWVKTNLAAKDVVFSETGIAYLDMAILAQCKHSIITSGTFGWWGAYLAGGSTVYFRDFPKPKTWLAGQYNKMDYYPPHWIPM